MLLDDVMSALARAGTPKNLATYARHGVKPPAFGVSYASQRALARRIKKDQPLAEALWSTENHDARILGTLVADPHLISGRVLAEWIADIDCYPLTDAVSLVAAGHPSALALAAGWRASLEEWTSRIGWQVLAHKVSSLDDSALMSLLNVIEKRIQDVPNWTKDAMNGALIAIGARGDRLRTLAIEAARRIGPLHVDHGDTGCKTPDAEAYILKILGRKAERAAAALKPAATIAKTTHRSPRRGKKTVKKSSSVTPRARRATRSE